MINRLKVLAIIPARGGSKRVKDKNIRLLNNRPLIFYSINAAKRTKYIDRIIVSTDSRKIAAVARRFGAEAPFLRPKNISADKTSDYPVIAHAVKWLETNQNFYPDLIVLLRPTAPIRKKGLLDKCIAKLAASSADALRTVRPVGRFHPYWMLKLDKNDFARPFIKAKTQDKYYQKQLLPELYEHDGYCDIIKRKNINLSYSSRGGLRGFYGKKIVVVINHDKFLVNIDTVEDFQFAEYVLKRRYNC